MALSRPTPVPFAFASSALPANVNTLPNDPTGSFTASWKQGFPPVTMTPLASGGSPPVGADFNGVLRSISENAQWANAGGQPAFNSTLSTNMVGYPVGAVLLLNDNVSQVVCTTAGNTNDPNVSATGWAPFGGARATAGMYSTATNIGNAYTMSPSLVVSAYFTGYRVLFYVNNSNTGSSTLNAGAGSVSLARSDDGALSSDDLIQGRLYEAVYDGAKFKLVQQVPSQLRRALSPSSTSLTVTSTTFVHLGLGGLWTWTAPASKRAMLSAVARATGVNANSRASVRLVFGTGSAPTAGAAEGSTTTVSSAFNATCTAVGDQFSSPIIGAMSSSLLPSPGVSAWADLVCAIGTAGQSISFTGTDFFMVEV